MAQNVLFIIGFTTMSDGITPLLKIQGAQCKINILQVCVYPLTSETRYGDVVRKIL